jgi:toxin ParE1/3/4
MAQVRTSVRAEEDMLDIWSFIAMDDPIAADKFTAHIQQKCQMLAENPRVGRLRQELGQNIRGYPVGEYVIFYMPEEDGVYLVRVLHGARDIDQVMGQDY